MTKTTNTRSSLSASTPDSLSDNEGSHGNVSGRYTPRKVTYTSTRAGMTPGGSRAGSKPNSRPLSRQGSKPPSRHGSTLSLDSTGKQIIDVYGSIASWLRKLVTGKK